VEKDAEKAIMKEYDKQYALYSAFDEKMKKLIWDLINENNLRVHSVTSRIKTKTSLRVKLARLERKFSELSDVADISGLRIVTYFADDVDSVAKVIAREFDVDMERSVDKRALLDPDRFGYLSLHYVVKLPADRLRLTEYRRFANCQAEIQIRSILQHAWAEIEHDLGYKGKHAVPREIQRRFSRLAGLLELADAEFAQIRGSLLEYEKNVPKQIAEAPETVLIDKASLLSFIKTSSLVHKFDRKIALISESEVIEEETIVDFLVGQLKFGGFYTIAQLDSYLQSYGEMAVRFAENWIEHKYETVSAGISLYYLNLVSLGSKRYPYEEAHRFWKTFLYENPEGLAEKLCSVYSKVERKQDE